MPTGPKGQKRPADVIGNAVRVMRIATGEEDFKLRHYPRPRLIFRVGREGIAHNGVMASEATNRPRQKGRSLATALI